MWVIILLYDMLFWPFVSLGGTICWLTKGCQSSLKDELIGDHIARNGFIGTVFLVFGLSLFVYIYE